MIRLHLFHLFSCDKRDVYLVSNIIAVLILVGWGGDGFGEPAPLFFPGRAPKGRASSPRAPELGRTTGTYLGLDLVLKYTDFVTSKYRVYPIDSI
jgi:hypothetical protein